jgi:hypothetical protein
MSRRFSAVFAKVCWGGLLLALLGCSRSAVVMAPAGAPHADESDSPAVARGKSDEPAGTPFAFPEDASGVLLAKVLPPKQPEVSRLDRAAPPSYPSASLQMKPPALPLPPSHAAIPRLPAAIKPVPLRPRLALDETPSGLPDSPVLPALPSLPDTGRVRVPSVDVNQPIPLPVLAQPVSDRASLDDPTADASVTAALAAPIPSRTTKAPFLKRTLPDPYDHRRSRTTAAPEEQTEPPLGTPQTPSQPATSRP